MGMSPAKAKNLLVERSFIDLAQSFRLLRYSLGVMTGNADSLKSFPFLVMMMLQSAFMAQ
jgi:hypothetical protein